MLIDYYSKYIELAHLLKFDSKMVISRLEVIFALFVIPNEIFTDNGTQLVSREMKEFA